MIPPLSTPVTMTLQEVLLLLESLLSATEGKTPLADALHTLHQRLAGGAAAPAVGMTFREAAEASLQARAHRRPATRAALRSYTTRMLAYPRLADTPLGQVDIPLCRALLAECFHPGPHVQRKAQSVLHSIFAYSIRHGWCTRNPAEGIDLTPAQEREVRPLSIPQIRRLLRCCARPRFRCMDPAVRLMLWCGIRPGEVQRLSWRDIDPAEATVYIPPQHSKTGGARAVPLRGGAAVLAELRPPAEQRIAPRSWNYLWKELRRTAKLHHWQQDALRHTFASYHLKHFHNIILLQEEMGHRDSHLLQTRYLNLRHITKRDARTFFNHIC